LAVGDEGIDGRRAERRKLERRKKTFRRRRLAALGGLIAVAAVAFILISGGGDGSKSPSPASKKAASTGASGSAPKPSLVAKPTGPEMSSEDARKARVPILMYHSISVPPPGASLGELFLPTANFKEQMKYLSDQGYEAVTLDQLWSAWQGKGPLPEKPIVLSFDDGYETQYAHAAPVLKQLGWPGVLNLKLLSLEQGEMTPTMIKKMIGDGWEIDSHTINHLDVSTLSGAELQHEVGDSRTMLQKEFGIPVDFFCYPAGKFDAASIAAVKQAGYLGATTVETGLAAADLDPDKLPRIRIDGSDSLGAFKQKLDQAS
jgi:peptidoglycan/xylan/chitin deacetylase (PgdA/CDA1 family)